MKTALRTMVNLEQRMAILPDPMWDQWMDIYNMLFADGAKGLKLKASKGGYERIFDSEEDRLRDIVFVKPHPVAQDRKQDVKQIRDSLFTLSYKVMGYIFNDILSGKLLDSNAAKKLRTDSNAKPLEFDAFWRNMVVHRIRLYYSWITIQYWAFMLCCVYDVKVTEAEQSVFRFKLTDFSTWDGPDVPAATRYPLQSTSGVKPAERTVPPISRGVKDDWRPNVWQMKALRQCVSAHNVDYVVIDHEPDGTLKVKVPTMWDLEEFPAPVWKPPPPITASMSEAEKEETLRTFVKAGGITQDKDITLNAERALGECHEVYMLYNQWKSDIVTTMKLAKDARKGAISAETAARASAAAGLQTEIFQVTTQECQPSISPSNYLLLGKLPPVHAFGENPKVTSFCCAWVLHIPVIRRSMGMDTPPLDPAAPNKFEVEQSFLEAADYLRHVISLIADDAEVPTSVLPRKVTLHLRPLTSFQL